MLTYVYSGKISVTTANKTYSLSAGQAALFGRNQLAKFAKEPLDNEAYQSVTIFFTQQFLQKFYATEILKKDNTNRPKLLFLKTNDTLNELFQSIGDHLNSSTNFVTNNQAQRKINDALTLIQKLDAHADDLLSDFSEPHKIDLAGFMQTNFMFNIPISKFAYLTGRSLSTFKRDFEKVFGTSPQRWLTEKRLERAHFLIAEKHQKPSQAFLDAGFENLSHFSRTFKRFFGYNPSHLGVVCNYPSQAQAFFSHRSRGVG